MAGPYPKEIREDVAAIARSREGGVTIKQIATDFGIGEATLQNWLRKADVEDCSRPGQTASDATETRELKKRIVPITDRRLRVPQTGRSPHHWSQRRVTRCVLPVLGVPAAIGDRREEQRVVASRRQRQW
ncbi:transposase [Luteimicrobium sp. DT211]|uniref:transposase n=1 Tax=Luteimicrobium sp. DT211 TaxID=3393412 RepID=UPI003CF6E024